ncbi:MAG: XrtN system VIT domain-containing protein [Flavobacteriales bacterium]|nr:XrtN system VIT domain-containing protein [Bacteroidota bacterium]MCB9240134.1 XrtN system VIT domain-containing protein [Flavobacteriales bacterium]
MENNQTRFWDPENLKSNQFITTAFGLMLLVVSLYVFTQTNLQGNWDILENNFLLTYGFTLFYLIVVLVHNFNNHSGIRRFRSFGPNIILLQLANVSAFTLNQSIPIYPESSNGLTLFLIVTNVTLIIYAVFRNYIPKILHPLFLLIFSAGLVFTFYQSILAIPGTVLTALTFWFFGISLHILVPYIFFFVYLRLVLQLCEGRPVLFAIPGTIVGLMVIITIFLSVKISRVNEIIETTFHESHSPYADNDLPIWVTVSSKLPDDVFTKLALGGMAEFNTGQGFEPSFLSARRGDEHNPFMVVLSLFQEQIDLDQSEREKILKSLYNHRHQNEEHLWSDESLITKAVVTNIRLYPDYRTAYTELTLSIKNTAKHDGNRGEALYTFHLPEGTVVTSASLWVEGIERKSILTTRAKADSAYQTIVGREQRDPLLIHWQEGNRVTARIFPCTAYEDRQFKIGFTSPLQYKQGRLIYHNIDFQGPSWENASESITVMNGALPVQFESDLTLNTDGNNRTYFGAYETDWTMSFQAPPISPEPFVFQHKAYHMQQLKSKEAAQTYSAVYLDINQSWTRELCNDASRYLDHGPVFICLREKLVPVNKDTYDKIATEAREQNFTLFPFYQIGNQEHALVVTSSHQLTPNLSDLTQTPFLEKLEHYFKQPRKVDVLNLGEEITPYFKSLHELNAIKLISIDPDELQELAQDRLFVTHPESDSLRSNIYGGFTISRSDSDLPNSTSTPSHLMRLYEYDNLMGQIGVDISGMRSRENDFLHAAATAHILTPVSSLIVLETAMDYERFDIQNQSQSLGNANLSNTGSVPEPHEWLLIITVGLLLLWMYLKR